jgi:type I restriction enzyme S subunit
LTGTEGRQPDAGWPTAPLGALTTSISSGKTTERLSAGAVPLYGSVGPIGRARKAEFVGPSIIVARVGANAGSVYQVDGAYAVSDNALVVRLAGDRNVDFMTEVLIAKNLNRMVYGSGQPLITGAMLKRVEVPNLAPEDEAAIAQVMTDAGHVVRQLERLTIKKEALNAGLSQQLLGRRTRLPGFGEDWKPTPVHAMGSLYGGLTGKSKADFGRGDGRYVPFTAVMADVRVGPETLRAVRVAPGERQQIVRNGDLLFNTSSETPDELAVCAVAGDLPGNTYLNSFCFGLRPEARAELEPLFVAYLLRSEVGRRKLSILAQGATRYNLSKSQFRNIVLDLPDLTEQRAIAHVLSDADANLDAVRRRLAKARAVKQGVVHELLGSAGPRYASAVEPVAV